MLMGVAPAPGFNRTEMAELAGRKPLPVIVSVANGSTVVELSEVIWGPPAAAATVTLAVLDFEGSAALATSMTAGLGLGRTAGGAVYLHVRGATLVQAVS